MSYSEGKIGRYFRHTDTVFLTRICKPFKEPRNRFPARLAGTTTLFVVPARQAAQTGGIDSSESIPGLLKRLRVRALVCYSPNLRGRNW